MNRADRGTLLRAFWSQENLKNVSIGGETERGLYSRTYRGEWIMLSLSRAVLERGLYLPQSQIILSVRIRNWMDIFVCLSMCKSCSGLMAMWRGGWNVPRPNGAFAPPTIARPPLFHFVIFLLFLHVFNIIILSHFPPYSCWRFVPSTLYMHFIMPKRPTILYFDFWVIGSFCRRCRKHKNHQNSKKK